MVINELVQTETFIWHDQDIICQMIVGIFPKNIISLQQNHSFNYATNIRIAISVLFSIL